MRRRVCIMAAGSWEPVVTGEYLMSEWILQLGRLSTVCTLTGAGFAAVLQLEEDVEAGLKALGQRVEGKYILEDYSCTAYSTSTAHDVAHFKEQSK